MRECVELWTRLNGLIDECDKAETALSLAHKNLRRAEATGKPEVVIFARAIVLRARIALALNEAHTVTAMHTLESVDEG